MAEAPTPLLVYDRIDANRRKTVVLLACFGLLVVPFVAGFIPFLVPPIIFGVLLPLLGEARFDQLLRETPAASLALAATLALVVTVAGTALAVAAHLRYSTHLVLRGAGARPLQEAEAPELRRAVDGLALAAGLPRPRPASRPGMPQPSR